MEVEAPEGDGEGCRDGPVATGVRVKTIRANEPVEGPVLDGSLYQPMKVDHNGTGLRGGSGDHPVVGGHLTIDHGWGWHRSVERTGTGLAQTQPIHGQVIERRGVGHEDLGRIVAPKLPEESSELATEDPGGEVVP